MAFFCRGIAVHFGIGVCANLLLYVSSAGLIVVMSAYSFCGGG